MGREERKVKEYIVHAPKNNPCAIEDYTSFYGEPIEELVRCKDCKHRFEGEIFPNCCEVLMEMSLWLVEIPVKDDWHCGSGERKEE